MVRYFMRWPVLDDDVRLSDLHAEAYDDLAEKLESEGLIAFGDIEFSIETAELPEGDLIELHAVVEVVPFRRERAA